MDKQMIFAIVIGLIMLTSVAGFAAFGPRLTGQVTQDQQDYTIPLVVDRPLTGQEISLILRQGRVVFESVYNEACDDCRVKDQELEFFARNLGGFAIISSVETQNGEGWEKFQMIGTNGKIVNLEEEEITQDNLLTLFCSIAIIQPKECILKTYE